MKIRAVIDRVKAQCPTFAGRVAGSAEYSAAIDALESVRLHLPSAFIYRAGGVPTEASTIGAVVQMLPETFGVIVALDNGADARGQAASEMLDDILDELLDALLGWRPDEIDNAFVYEGDQHLDMNRGRLWHVFLFGTSHSIESRPDVNA